MCMYYTKGINQDGYILCRQCNMKKDEHPIFMYIYDMTSQCDDIILLIQEYIKVSNNNIACGHMHSVALLQDNTVRCWGMNNLGQCNVPNSIQGKVISICSNNDFVYAVLNDNSIKYWRY